MTRQPSANGSTIAPLLRAVSQWLIGVALAVLLTLLFVAISAVQLSSEGTGQRLLRRSIAVSTDIDAVLPDIETALQERARGETGGTVRVPDFPIPIDLPRDEALLLEGPALRARILSEASDRVYADGMSTGIGKSGTRIVSPDSWRACSCSAASISGSTASISVATATLRRSSR